MAAPEPPEWIRLVTVEHPSGTAGVCRDTDNSVWLVHVLEDELEDEDWDDEDPVTDDGYDWRDEVYDRLVVNETAGLGTSVDGIAAVAGYFPEGACELEIRTEDGAKIEVVSDGEVWMALLDPSLPDDPYFVFRDRKGRIVRRPVPDRVELAPIDVSERCPACGGQTWESATVPDHGPDGEPYEFNYQWDSGEHAAVCSTCGNTQRLPGPVQHVEVKVSDWNRSEDERRAARLVRTVQVWTQLTERIGSAPLGLDDRWTGLRFLGGWGGPTADEVTDVTLEHRASASLDVPWVRVSTGDLHDWDSFNLFETWLEPNLATLVLPGGGGSGDDDPAGQLEGQLAERRVRAEVHSMRRGREAIQWNGKPIEFTLLGGPDAWVAHAVHGQVEVTIVSNQIPIGSVGLVSTNAADYTRSPT